MNSRIPSFPNTLKCRKDLACSRLGIRITTSFIFAATFLITPAYAQSIQGVFEEIRKSNEQALRALTGRSRSDENRVTYDAEEPGGEVHVLFQVFNGKIIVTPNNEEFEESELDKGTLMVVGDNIQSSEANLINCTDEQNSDDVLRLSCPEDKDGDGLLDHLDRCPESRVGAGIDQLGCEIIHKFDNLEFVLGSYQLSSQARVKLRNVAASLRDIKFDKYAVTGHTDSVGSEEVNQELGLKRAKSVANFLIQSGVSAERLVVQSFGETRPIADNSTKAGRDKNRRVEIVREPTE